MKNATNKDMSLFGKDKTTPVKKSATKAPAKEASMKEMYADAPESKKSDKSENKTAAVNQAYRVLIKPIVSEKASRQQTTNNQYFFAVAIGANKIEIAKAIKTAYGVTPINVSVIRMEGKSRRYGRVIGKRKDWKKAIVTLAKGKTIALHEGV